MAEGAKRVLIFSHAMELGGAERSLIGLLQALVREEVRVDLFLMGHRGPLMDHIPKEVNLLPEIPGYASLAVPIGTVLRRRQFGVALGRCLGKLAAGMGKRRLGIRGESGIGLECSHRFTCPFLPDVGQGEYDLAVSFLTPHHFVAEKVRARKRIAWVHTDYTQLALDRAAEERMWRRYDRIAAVSAAVGEGFSRVFPALGDRVVVMENLLPGELLRGIAAGGCPADFPREGAARLLSVGRFCHAKNFDNVPDLCRRLLASGLDVKWYLIGFGPEEDLIRRRIRETGMQEQVILLGKRENPYPYLASCDLYVQPSRYEGCAVAVREAQLLGRCVVITRYPTWAGQLDDGFDGIAVPMDNPGCAAGIAALLRDPEKRQRLAENARRRPQPAAAQLRELLRWMEEDPPCPG